LRRVNDNLIALFDPAVYFYLRTQIARGRHLADMHSAFLDHGNL
jgi:hypothetical protein